ncbi:glycosyl hydrolase family 17 protein [Mangrovibacterium sp.]|uniref:glycoside hydrolase family 17 protein n=1 Tax=Mangrovibacterium sp. TaxID=1961364 RepID=UPI00356A8B91
MSFRSENILSLAGRDFSNTQESDLRSLFTDILNQGMHGLCFSPYLDFQSPGDIITEEQIHQKMEIIRPYTKWIRTFSVSEGNELIPKVAKQYGLKTMVGAWLGEDEEKNEEEIQNLIKLANEGVIDLAAVGNEVLYRDDLPEEVLLSYIRKVKKAIPTIPVGYVDAYYEFCDRPAIAEACDVIFANCYPFWEGCHIDYSLLYMKDMYHKAKNAAPGKRVIITETGWPNLGSAIEASEPSLSNAIKYFINAQQWSKQEGIELFWFSSFDEAWKQGVEGDVGAYWGLWDKDGKLKYTNK